MLNISRLYRLVVFFAMATIATIEETPSTSPQIALAQGGGTRVYLPLIMKYPSPIKSHYMIISKPNFNPYALGQMDAQEHQPIIQSGNRIVFVLGFGQPCKVGGVEGAYSYDENSICHSISEFETHVKNYLDGYCAKMQAIRPGGSGQNCGYRYSTTSVPVFFTFGPVNCGSLACNPNNTPNTVTYSNGQAWGTLVSTISSYALTRGYAYQILVAGAMDIEGDWNTYANTKNWINGFKNTAPFKPVYNYGNCGCPDAYQPGGPFFHDWDYNKIHEVSFRATIGSDVIPQIYHTNGVDARRWQGVSKWAANNGFGKAIFRQLLTTLGRCAQGANCAGINNSPANAIDQINQALNADAQTANGLATDVRSTDIENYPFP